MIRKNINKNGSVNEETKIFEESEQTNFFNKRMDTSEKQFEARNSILTDLFEDKHIRTVKHIGITILITLFLQTAAYDYIYKQQINIGFNLIRKGFVNFHFFILIWLGMFVTTFIIHFGFKCWSAIRIRQTRKSITLNIWDFFWLGLFIFFIPFFMYISTEAVLIAEQQVVASMALLIEMARFLMKCYAFVRSNATRVLNYPNNKSKIICPSFEKFLYFLFAPTLVYQDDYPRTKAIRWKYVLTCCMEFLGTLFMFNFLIERFYIPPFEDYGRKPFTWKDIAFIILSNTGPGFLVLLTVDYMVFHTWSNAFAELLRFSDRLFYKDWWISSSYNRYYRTWNVLIHDWLYTYVYKDLYQYVTPKSKYAAKLMVFIISAASHEYILSFSCKFFFPTLSIMFIGGGAVMTSIKIRPKALGNIQLLHSAGLGVSIMSSLYALEYYARINCPIQNPTIADYFMPHFVNVMYTCQ